MPAFIQKPQDSTHCYQPVPTPEEFSGILSRSIHFEERHIKRVVQIIENISNC